jgi:hypothetical protein
MADLSGLVILILADATQFHGAMNTVRNAAKVTASSLESHLNLAC